MTTTLTLPPGPHAAYLFDLDGTIVDSMPLHYLSWSQAIREHGGHFPEDLFYAMGGLPLLRIVEELNKKFNYTMAPLTVVHRKESLFLTQTHLLQPVAAVADIIAQTAGKIPFAIVSGSPRDTILKTLTHLNLLHLFPVIVGSEDYTHGKPHPEPFLTAARILNVPPAQCLVFEDAQPGIEAARAAGMACVLVPGKVMQ